MYNQASTDGENIWFSHGSLMLPFKNGLVDIKYQVPSWQKVNSIQLVSSYGC